MDHKEINKRWERAGHIIPNGVVSYGVNPNTNKLELSSLSFEVENLSQIKGLTILKEKFKELELDPIKESKKDINYTG